MSCGCTECSRAGSEQAAAHSALTFCSVGAASSAGSSQFWATLLRQHLLEQWLATGDHSRLSSVMHALHGSCSHAHD